MKNTNYPLSNRRIVIYSSFLILVLLSSNAAAQGTNLEFSGKIPDKSVVGYLQKGSKYVGLNGVGTYASSPNFSTSRWSSTVQAGHFFANRFVAGVQLSYGRMSQTLKTNASIIVPTYKVASWSPELFGRYYLTSLKIKPLLQLSTGYSFQDSRREVSGLPTFKPSSQLVVNGAVGISYFFSKSIAAEMIYNHRFTEKQQLDANADSKLRLGVTIMWD